MFVQRKGEKTKMRCRPKTFPTETEAHVAQLLQTTAALGWPLDRADLADVFGRRNSSETHIRGNLSPGGESTEGGYLTSSEENKAGPSGEGGSGVGMNRGEGTISRLQQEKSTPRQVMMQMQNEIVKNKYPGKKSSLFTLLHRY